MRPTFIQENIALAPYTSWQIGGPARYFARPKTAEEVTEAQTWARKENHKITWLGDGSNVLVADEGLGGLTIVLDQFKTYSVSEEAGRVKIVADAGVGKNELLKVFLKHKLAPALFLAGIPGSVGGGVVMNAGVAEQFKPREFVEITDWVEILTPDGHIVRKEARELHWAYRHCTGWQPGMILRAGLSWPNEPDPTILEQVRNANKIRSTKQPLELPSCGSVFVNPPGHKSAQLIDSSGLKGYTVGGAQVSLKHANFIVNTGGAKAADVAAVIKHVRETVKAQKGVELNAEVIQLRD